MKQFNEHNVEDSFLEEITYSPTAVKLCDSLNMSY